MKIAPNHRVRLRELCGLSLRDLEDHTGVSRTRLNQWELNGPPELHTNELRTIRNVLLELSGSNHREVRRLLSRTPGRDGLRPREVEAVSRDRRSQLVSQGGRDG
jgi:transcriptional regulator with XRE-family HTH domain